jgi:hypothetical protein
MVVSLIAEHGHIQAAVEILSGMLTRTFGLSLTADSGLRQKLPESAMSANSVVAGIALAHFLVKRRYFQIASNLLDTLSQDAGATLGGVINCVRAKLYLASNRFEAFRRSVPALDLRTVQSLSGFRALTAGTISFDVTFTALKLLAKACLERRAWGNGLFWSELMLHAIPSLSYRNIGAAHLLRGRAFAMAVNQHWGADGLVSVQVPCRPAMSAIASYGSRTSFTRTQLLCEALASLRMVRVSQERIGGMYRHMQASAELAELVLRHFLDSESPLTIGDPLLVTELKGARRRRISSSGEPLDICRKNVSDFLSGVIAGLSQTAAKSMYPPLIIYAQVLAARARLLADDVPAAKQAVDFAFGNLQRYFFSSNEFIATDCSLSVLGQFRGILANLCYCLFGFDKDFLNAKLIAFDWLADIDDFIANRLRCVVDENRAPIDAKCEVKLSTLKHFSNPQFPDFFRSLPSEPQGDDGPRPTIAGLLALARANMRLCEQQRLDETAMTAANRALCLQIEEIAKNHRADKPNLPAGYAAVRQLAAIARGAIFVERLFDSIFVYVPRTGELRRVRLEQGSEQSFKVVANRAEEQFSTAAALFDSDFYALVGMLLVCDKKQRHLGFDRAAAISICQRARARLFGDIGNSLDPWPVIPDDALFGERRPRGALFSLCTSPDPIIFATSADLRGLPLELMFPDQLVLRCSSFVQLALRPSQRRDNPAQVVICRWIKDRDRLMARAVARSIEAIQTLLQACGSPAISVPHVDEAERKVCFPFPLFSSNVENLAYSQKFPFCEVVDVAADTFPERDAELYIFTYSDLCEMPVLVEELMKRFPFAHFMFIPAQFVREAFALMGPIFERQEKRRALVAKAEIFKFDNGGYHLIVSSVAFDFVTLLQGTLIRTLGCPVAVIVPGV